MNKKILTPEKVENIFMDCFFKENENKENPIIVEGITGKFGFHPQRIENNKKEIYKLLMELPEKFRKNVGGGWSFLNACIDKNGSQWTGEHKIMEQLFCLGIAIGAAEWLTPRSMWDVFPGAMPYCAILEIKEGKDEGK